MPITKICLEQDAKGVVMSDEDRINKWATSAIVSAVVENDTHKAILASNMAKLVTEFAKDKWVDKNGPTPELGLMFAVNKRVLKEILDQQDCEGVRIYLSSDNGKKTDVVIKPIDSKLEDLDDKYPTRDVKICEDATECPPDTRCPTQVFDRFKNELIFLIKNGNSPS